MFLLASVAGVDMTMAAADPLSLRDMESRIIVPIGYRSIRQMFYGVEQAPYP